MLGIGLLAGAVSLLSAGAASATVTTANITSPTGGYLQYNYDAATTVTVAGTSNGTTGDFVNVDCWYDDGNSRTLVSSLAVQSDGSFSTGISPVSLLPISGRACRLRAEPTTFGGESAAFTGPRIAVSAFRSSSHYTISGGPNNGALYDYYANGTTFGSYVGWNSAGDCGPYAESIDPSYAYGNYALDCVGSLYGNDGFSRSEIQIDGSNAYTPQGAENLFSGASNNVGFQPLSVSQSWNAGNGFESTSETDPLVECPSPDPYLPTSAQCPSYSSAPVTLTRQIAMIGVNQIKLTDTWTSTDGHAHSVDAEYDDYVENDGSHEPSFEFPGESALSRHAPGDVIGGAASAPGTILTHTDSQDPDGDPGENYGAITFSSAPSGFVFSKVQEFSEHQTLAVPAGGSASLSYIYSFGPSLEQVQALALAAQDQLKTPALSITAPPNGSRRHARTVTVSGTASAGSGIRSVTVNGVNATLASGGAWSAQVTLRRGTQTLTATATSNTGLTASASITVIYAKRCVVPRVKGLGRGKAERTIHAAGCTIGKIIKQHSSLDKGDAVGTKPKPGSTRKPGAKVKLIISEG